MPNNPSTDGRRLWRLLIDDRDPADPKLIIATVTEPGDVQDASPGVAGDATAWVRHRLGYPSAELVPMPRATAFRIDESPGKLGQGSTL